MTPTAAATVEGPDRHGAGRAPGRRGLTVTAVVALVGVLLALVGIGLATRPLHTPSQDCGTAASFLLRGGVDEFVDPADPPAGVTAAEAANNNADPCQERAANRARPAGVLVVGGTALGLGSALVELVVRFRLRRRALRRWLAAEQA